MRQKNMLWYKNPAVQWIDALPVGNGRIGAMVYGGTLEERIQIDESSFWSGAASRDNNRPGTKALMEQIRKALLSGNYEEADRLGHGFVGNKNQYGTNMPVGELKLKLTGLQGEVQSDDYLRYLDLENSLSGTRFNISETQMFRECFVSNPSQVFCMKIEAGERFGLEIRYEGIGNQTALCSWDGEYGRISGDALETLHSDGTHGVHLEGCVKLLTDGTIWWEDGVLYTAQASRLELFLDLETTMFMEDPEACAKERVEKAVFKGYDSCREEHIQDVQPLFQRMDISLGQEDKSEIPTDVRIKHVIDGEEDLSLYALMYQYGRYLLIASSREDSPLPTHMGGIWNDNIYNNIDCTQDMHIDMNLQMQYWAAALCSLPECYQPFFRYMKQVLIPSGTCTAREAYEADGWTAHVVSNPWGFTSLGWAYNWGAWSLGGAWCAVMIWDYYEYTKDRPFLEKDGYCMLDGAVRFVLDYVFMDEESGYFMAGPSYSPENQFSVDGKNYFLALSNTCDVLLIRELLSIYLKARLEIGIKEDIVSHKVAEVLEKLPPYKLGKKGQLQEWFYDFDEPIPNHRHTSHLLGLYPFSQIDAESTPELAEGVRKSIALRYDNFEITSWGMNMLLGYYARLGDGVSAGKIIRDTFEKLVRTNLASVMSDETSMWMGTWELDGNTGFTAAMTELLIQSSEKEIKLLPSLPPEWAKGQLLGVSVKNAGKADIYWKNGRLKKAYLKAGANGHCKIRYGDNSLAWEFRPGDTLEINENTWT
ncbi:glycoside hydrolase family 95 protein [Blautia schinkii]|nr:glycoside hydrolase family 95 protein [Blautia schinkii]